MVLSHYQEPLVAQDFIFGIVIRKLQAQHQLHSIPKAVNCILENVSCSNPTVHTKVNVLSHASIHVRSLGIKHNKHRGMKCEVKCIYI